MEIKLQQRNGNPDAFDLLFFWNTDSTDYSSGRTYWVPRISTFERSEFETFEDSGRASEKRIEEFVRRLVAGELQQVNF
jgi:hypothetical protein